jgi:F0F1-type ATP synthase membrane subunit b/b'
MKKTIYILLTLGIIPFLNFSFVYSEVADTLYYQKVVKTSDIPSETKENVCSYSNNDYIAKMTLFVTVTVAIFAFFIALNIFNSNKNLQEAKSELESLKKEKDLIIESLKKEKVSIVESIENEVEKSFNEYLKEAKNTIVEDVKNEGKKLFKEYIAEFRTQYTIEEIKILLSQDKPNKKEVFIKLSSIIEHINVRTAYIVKKCTYAFPEDKDIKRLASIALSNIAKEPDTNETSDGK